VIGVSRPEIFARAGIAVYRTTAISTVPPKRGKASPETQRAGAFQLTVPKTMHQKFTTVRSMVTLLPIEL
jgi:hypothetical protein